MCSDSLSKSTNGKRSVGKNYGIQVEGSYSVLLDNEDEDEDENGHVLSEETRRNFDIIRSIVAECDGNEPAGAACRNSAPSPPPSIHLKRRMLDEVASSTVRMIHEEISHWQRSIAELEAMLAASNEEMAIDMVPVNNDEKEEDNTGSHENLDYSVMRTQYQGLQLHQDGSSMEQARSVSHMHLDQLTSEECCFACSAAHASEDEGETGSDACEDHED